VPNDGNASRLERLGQLPFLPRLGSLEQEFQPAQRDRRMLIAFDVVGPAIDFMARDRLGGRRFDGLPGRAEDGFEKIGEAGLQVPAHITARQMDHAPTLEEAVWAVNPAALLPQSPCGRHRQT
jgi:hypothetical protein